MLSAPVLRVRLCAVLVLLCCVLQVFLSQRPLSFATSLLLACALCIHSILEGLALGAQQSMQVRGVLCCLGRELGEACSVSGEQGCGSAAAVVRNSGAAATAPCSTVQGSIHTESPVRSRWLLVLRL